VTPWHRLQLFQILFSVHHVRLGNEYKYPWDVLKKLVWWWMLSCNSFLHQIEHSRNWTGLYKILHEIAPKFDAINLFLIQVYWASVRCISFDPWPKLTQSLNAVKHTIWQCSTHQVKLVLQPHLTQIDDQFPTWLCIRAWKSLGFWGKNFLGFKVFLGFSVLYKEDLIQKLRPRKNILYTITILPVTSLSVYHNKTHRSRLKYEIKYDL